MMIVQNREKRNLRNNQELFSPLERDQNTNTISPQLIGLWYKLLQEQGNFEITQQNVTTIKITQHVDDEKEVMNEDLFIHLLLQDSHIIAKKMEEKYKIDDTEEYKLDGILNKYNDDEENSADLIKSIRE